MENNIKSSNGGEVTFSSKGLSLSKNAGVAPLKSVESTNDSVIPLKKIQTQEPSEILTVSKEAQDLAKKERVQVAKTIDETPRATSKTSSRIKAYGDAQETISKPKGFGFDASA